jgi:hypothetical protein
LFVRTGRESALVRFNFRKLYHVHDPSRDRLHIRFSLSGIWILRRGEGGGGEPLETEVVAEHRGNAGGATRRLGRCRSVV